MKPHIARWTGLFLALAMTVFTASAAQANMLDDYRRDGTVVERWDGFLEARDSSASAEVRAFVSQVNAQRRQIYQQRAQENGVPVSEIGKLYAAEILEKAPSGTLFKDDTGTLIKKP